MSEQVCKNCGKVEEVHSWIHGLRACVTTFFEQPLKAKPGVRYRNTRNTSWGHRTGTVNGDLAFTYHGATTSDYHYSVEPMSPDWEEVPE